MELCYLRYYSKQYNFATLINFKSTDDTITIYVVKYNKLLILISKKYTIISNLFGSNINITSDNMYVYDYEHLIKIEIEVIIYFKSFLANFTDFEIYCQGYHSKQFFSMYVVIAWL